MNLSGKALEKLVNALARQAIQETLGPLREDERERQNALEKDLKDLKPSKPSKKSNKDKDLEEAEDEESDKGDEKTSKPEKEEKPKVVSKKLATGKPEPEAPEAVIPDATDIKDVTFDQVVTLVNMMRSGRSAKNPDTNQSLSDYFKGLNPGERQALFVLLSGITQILAGGVEGADAPDPGAVGIKIKPRRADRDAKSQTGGVPRDPAIAKPSLADASMEPVPIVVGESSSRNKERAVLEGLRKSLRERT